MAGWKARMGIRAGNDELCTLGAVAGTNLGAGAKSGGCPTLGEVCRVWRVRKMALVGDQVQHVGGGKQEMCQASSC